MRRSLLLLALLLPAALLWTLFQAAAGEPAAAPSPAPRPTDTTWLLAAPVAVTPSARPALPHSATPATPITRPEPFVQTFAAQPGRSPLPRLPSPTAPLQIPVNVDGCDRSYGTRSQCIPWHFPPGTTDACAWLRARGFLNHPLTSHGADRHHLDPDTNGLACDP